MSNGWWESEKRRLEGLVRVFRDLTHQYPSNHAYPELLFHVEQQLADHCDKIGKS